jgi:NADH-quinone oxidoreductase chain G
MKTFKYFQINNINFNYDLEFQTNNPHDSWKTNAPLIDYCETLGINIPHYCYHKSLSISGNCRMCLIELKNSPKPVVSCSMSAKSCLNNGSVYTDSPLVKKSRENVLEFLLLNHPLDCPICDQGGECDLQDQSFFFGSDKKRFYNFKRIVTDKNLGLIVKTVMTRCIHCTRCVRFADEVAGVPNLGMFGRGLNSEIGTYVKKTFQSELSGNVIDLCPVGALTSKPYPFVSRSWELKSIKSIDFTDGFGSNLQVYLKNNRIVKVLPGYDHTKSNNSWISDKTRFSFDGMFSPNKEFHGVIKTKSKSVTSCWDLMFKEMVDTLYFHDQLNRHIYKNNKLTFVFDNNINTETLNMLILFSKKFSFIDIKKTDKNADNVDRDSKYLIKTNQLDLEKSDLCFLIGINPRYEGSDLNNMLRKRFVKGGFEVVGLGSSTNLTYATTQQGLTEKTLRSIIEGNHTASKKLINSSRPHFILSSELYSRTNSLSITNLLDFAENKKTTYSPKICVNTLNLSVNEAGVRYLKNFTFFKNEDFDKKSGVYFINVSKTSSSNLRKIINLKLFSYNTNLPDKLPKYCFEHNYGNPKNPFETMSNQYPVYSYINLPNANIFESNVSYLNTKGIFKTSSKFVSTHPQIKEDWHIIRKLFACTSTITFTNNFLDNHLIFFNNNTLNKFKSFTNFMYKATSNLTTTTESDVQIKIFNKPYLTNFKTKKTKTNNTKLKLWLNDFYISGKDSFSKTSITMINCSKLLRSEKTNFNNLTTFNLFKN